MRFSAEKTRVREDMGLAGFHERAIAFWETSICIGEKRLGTIAKVKASARSPDSAAIAEKRGDSSPIRKIPLVMI
jgi:hypothetical protein